jgi:RNA polymerase sigma factor (sigma-70 family)
MASAAIAIEPIASTVDPVQAFMGKWVIPNHQKTPAKPHGVILPFIHASCDEAEDNHEDETKKVKVAGPSSHSPGPWLSVGLVDCLLSPEPEELTDAEQSRDERLRQQIHSGELPTDLRALASLYYLEERSQVECGEELGITQGAISKQLTRVRQYIAAKKAAK